MKNCLVRSLTPMFLVLFTCSTFFADEKEAAQDTNPDYKKVDKAHIPLILKMESGEIKDPVSVPWRLFVPPEASEKNPLPIVFMLHGAGARGTDNVSPIELAYPFWSEEAQKKNPCFVLVPQCPRGKMWVVLNRQHTNQAVTEKPTPEMTGALAALDMVLEKYPIDKKRIYLTGQSMGGYGTWEALYRRPNMWAAAIPVCGGGDPSSVEVFKHIPIWAWHGSNDKAVPVENTRQLIDALKKAGADPKYSEINAGHGSWGPAYASPEVHEWLFAQRKK